MLVTMLVILFGMAVYAGLGYLALKGYNKLYWKFKQSLWRFDEEITICYHSKIAFWASTIVELIVWPVTLSVFTVRVCNAYRKSMKEANEF